MNKPYLSIVSPVYGAEKIVDELVKRIVEESAKVTDNFEVILVEDGSPDNCWEKIQQNCAADKRVKGIKLSRNFGQHNAISAGLETSKGQFIIIMDCDLQDNPKDFKLLLDKANEGFDTVFTRRIDRKHSFIKKHLSRYYNKLFKLISKKEFSLDNGSLYLINRKVVDIIINLKEKPILMGQVIRWVGFEIGFIEVKHNVRLEGNSSYSLSKLLSMVWDGWISNSDRLLRIVIYIGIVISFFSFLFGLSIIFLKFYRGFAVGWSSIIVTILFSTGLILISLGILGLYVGKIFEQTKDRPLFIIDKKLNCND